eukprot:GFUD01027442.1.p1 GENE.GFUD01027442.1~~GFUD01027442.1.p1  ORF type:complete len:880 (+),score=162.84 GFUD01027442.1:356-2995(+)
MMSDNKSECGIYPPGNNSDPFHLGGNSYGGIPTNLITNAIVWLLLMILFIFIRKSAFKHMKLENLGGLFSNTERNMSRLIQVFFSASEPPAKSSSECEEGVENSAFRPSPIREPTIPTMDENGADTIVVCEDNVDGIAVSDHQVKDRTGISDSNSGLLNSRRLELARQNSVLKEGDSFLAWLGQSVLFSEATMLKLAGPDAVQYLRFQKYLIAFVLLTTILCICIILPFNFQGTLQGSGVDFGHTTLANLAAESSYLYVHMAIAFLLFPISIFIMRRFSIGLDFRDASLEITRTLQIENIPHHLCTEKLLRRHFKEAYPNIAVTDVKIVFDVTKLTEVSDELKNASDARKYGEVYKVSHKKDLEMYPYCAARCCSFFCACCTNKVEVVEFYSSEEQRLTREVQRQRELSVNTPLGMAFVTFTSLNCSKSVYDDHSRSAFWCSTKPPMSSLSPTLRPDHWRVQFAPPPRDIYWENLSDKRRWLVTRTVFSNICLFVVTLFLTTPEFIVSQLEPLILALFDETVQIPSWLKGFIPTIMLWSFTALLPVLVAYSVRWLGFWYRSEENHSIMIKSFWYLWIMVLIFPTFGFTTGLTLLENLFGPGAANGTDPIIRWECIFLPDSGAFFVNYVITAAFIGSGLELIRFPELFWYALQVCISRSEAESRTIQRAVTYEFRFGEQYARMLLLFAMVIMYSMSCPLITPFGLIYFILKHLVDKHNLAFVYAPSKINKSVHRSAINFVIFCVTLLQVFMTSFSFIRSWNGNLNVLSNRTKLSILLLFLSIIIFSAQIWSDFCKKMSPIKYVDILYAEDELEDEQDQKYIPDVLLPCYPKMEEEANDGEANYNENHSESVDSPGYGTFVKDLVTVDAIADTERLIAEDA